MGSTRSGQAAGFLPAAKLLMCLAGIAVPAIGVAQGTKTGEQVYKEVCVLCHGMGVENAPQYGDKVVWFPLLKEGQAVVTAHGWVGQGGRPDLTLEEFARAVVYMARAGGGNWRDPDPAMLDRIRDEEKKRMEELKLKR